jgi:hypothetical protein
MLDLALRLARSPRRRPIGVDGLRRLAPPIWRRADLSGDRSFQDGRGHLAFWALRPRSGRWGEVSNVSDLAMRIEAEEGADDIEVSEVSSSEQRRLVDAWIARHARD